jgi:hypothetical protein
MVIDPILMGLGDIPRFPNRHRESCGVSLMLRRAVELKVRFILDRVGSFG